MRRALVIGIGNPLRGDDGVGPRVAARLAARQDVDVRYCHQLTPELADDIAEAPLVVFVDATIRGRKPRAVRLSAPDRLPAPAASHVSSPGALLVLARRLYGRTPAAYLVTIPGRSFALGQALSPGATRGARCAVRAISRLLRRPDPTAG